MSTARDASTTDEDLAEVVARRGRPGGSASSADRAFRSLYDRHAPPLMAFLATLYPSWRASRVQPAEALRYE